VELKNQFPLTGALLGIDHGIKRVGLAICTPERNICFPLEIIERKQMKQDLEAIGKIAANYRVLGLVVGLPVHMSGDEGEQAALSRKFGEQLSQFTQLPLAFVDERFSSLTADKLLYQQQLSAKNRQQRRDAVAAQVLLQTFIDHGSIEIYCPPYLA
jgi:putative Holliday junction resolvase